ncbi:phosphatase PAP2 family protein [Blastococcus sp. TML/C7B]|nr:phosphatase PAP2 family protein [Blastococcus sp. TML/C7B]
MSVVAACAAVVALLGLGVRTGAAWQLDVDTRASEALYAGDDRSRWLDVLLEVLTAPGLSVVRYLVAVPVLIWLARRRDWRALVWVVVAAVFVRHLTSFLKEFFGRVRPPFEEGGAGYDSLSFPSGHSSGVAALVAIGLVLAWPRLSAPGRRLWGALGALLVLLVGLTRMWLGVHYLSDVVGGWALGLGWTLLTAVVFGVLPRREPGR